MKTNIAIKILPLFLFVHIWKMEILNENIEI